MKQIRTIMGMPISIEVLDQHAIDKTFEEVFDYFHTIDERFSTYKETSEITKINRGLLQPNELSSEMQLVLRLCEETRVQTNGYFNILNRDGLLDPSGLVKGWSIFHAAELLTRRGCTQYFLEAGGDIALSGTNAEGGPWRVGIRNPFVPEEIVKIVYLKDHGIATSGTYLRGQHIYNPFSPLRTLDEIVSLTVIGPNIYEADRFATAAFAMGRDGIAFIEQLPGFEGYQIDVQGIATMTTHFDHFTHAYASLD